MSHIEEVRRRFSLNGLRVVDVGAGTGAFANQLAVAGADVIGIEIDPAKVEQARQAASPEIRFETGRAESLPLPDNCADLVTVLYAWHHIPVAMHSAAADDIARVLVKGGKLFVAEPKTHGGMTEIILPVDDETTVRKQAESFLDGIGEGPVFRLVEKSDYILARRYKDYDALVRAVVYVDPARVALFEQNEDAVRKGFERLARPDDDGFLIDQPTTLYVFEKL